MNTTFYFSFPLLFIALPLMIAFLVSFKNKRVAKDFAKGFLFGVLFVISVTLLTGGILFFIINQL